MKADTWQSLESEFAQFPLLRGQPASPDDIGRAAASLGVSFPPDYAEFLRRYGAAIVGPFPIFGLAPVEPLGRDWSVVSINERFRADRWPGPEGWVIVSQDHAGNPIGLDANGRVWISDHGAQSVIANDFESFLLDSLRLSGAI